MLAPALRSHYHLSLGQTGILLGASLGGSVLTLVPWGMAADAFGERAVLVAGVGACGVALLGASLVSGFWALFACLLVAGMSGASVQSASGRAVMAWFPHAQRGLALGVRQTAIPIGGFVVALGLPPVERAGGVHAGLAAIGIACLVSTTVAGLVLREAPAGEEARLRPRPVAAARPAHLGDGRRERADRRTAAVRARVHGRLPARPPRRSAAGSAALVLAATQLLGIGGADRRRPLVGRRREPARARCGRSRWSPRALTLLTAAALGAPLVLLVPLLVATGVLAMSWNGLAFAAAAEVAGRSRSGAAIGLQQSVLERHRRDVSAALRPARRRHLVALPASPRSRSSRSPGTAPCGPCAAER